MLVRKGQEYDHERIVKAYNGQLETEERDDSREERGSNRKTGAENLRKQGTSKEQKQAIKSKRCRIRGREMSNGMFRKKS